ncbi:cysteine proteinase [Sodiomyces alkalinus F11]|uniref:ubiquitinyl hydrolase 1 n=1 Tax=Sodiomyces alkalinus (strain CBS 110278 / VKM F-3762 / F11) TaxID=1314773 RepID=A0A3N2Q3Y5_SODAK|nr:cysteine proteinase [Sodiomyces alkalinus F11]ROT41484.1 cysteine proteinase [Sodiomyces alkalinus F11]
MPTIPHYVPMAGVAVSQPYPRQHQQSPALATPYQPPPIPGSVLPQTPTSTQSSHTLPGDTPLVVASPSPAAVPQADQALPPQQPPPVPVAEVEPVAQQEPEPEPQQEPQQEPEPELVSQPSAPSPQPAAEAITPEVPPTQPFRPPLPWLSRPDQEFPKKTRFRRKRRAPMDSEQKRVTLPTEQQGPATEGNARETMQKEDVDDAQSITTSTTSTAANPSSTPKSDNPVDSPPEATTTEKAPEKRAKEVTGPTASASGASVSEPAGRSITPRPAIPVVPVVPAVPKSSPKAGRASAAEKATDDSRAAAVLTEEATIATPASGGATDQPQQEEKATPKPAPRPPVSSWSALFAKPGASAASKSQTSADGSPHDRTANGVQSANSGQAANADTAQSQAGASPISAALRAYKVGNPQKIKFIEPRGLINIGNMCYMNSVLQVLLYCVPFYDFLDQIAEKVPLSFKSQTPILDAMILFMKEFQTIAAGDSAAKLGKILKNEELEQYGASFTPEFIYQAIEPDKRFENMRRGHQQDAEEFFGLLLQSLDEECAKMMGVAAANGVNGSSASPTVPNTSADGWLEVGAKQRAAVTRSSGASSSTPISQIFGGLLRSELRVTGKQNSITTEPYQALQLDIGAPEIKTVVDALIRLTSHEKLEGAGFDSPRGKQASVTKQTLIETLPPILILHLKRFHFDAEGGTTKIWKRVGYPLELEIPAQALSKQWHLHNANKGAGGPKYKLVAAVYHHGKHANGGHYTVDVRRQDEQEWIRLDDTVIRRVRSEDVAEVGEEEPVKGASQGSGSRDASANRFGSINDEDTGDRGEWTPVDKTSGSKKNRWSNGTSGPDAQPRGKQPKDNIKDNKVAYLLFYQRV